jgi:hypothetical protein
VYACAVRSRIVILLALGALLAVLPTAAFGGAAHRTANNQTFQDSTGEDPDAPDVTSVQVSNDDAGLLTFQINISNRPALTNDMFILLFVDTDQNAATGDQGSFGAEFVIQLIPGSADLFQWNGSDYVPAQSQTSLTFGYGPTGATIHIAASELNKTKALKFGVLAASGVVVGANGDLDFTNVHEDAAPDFGHGFWPYQVLTKIVLTQTAFTVSPKPAHAGRPVSVSLAANENDTNGPVQSGTVVCAATLGGKRVVAKTHAFANGIATCIWATPKTAKGKFLRGTITLKVQGASLTRPFAAKLL